MNELYFSSQLPQSYLADVEHILHFNPHQYKVLRSIGESEVTFGLPQIIHENGFLTMQMSGGVIPQTLYVLDSGISDASLLALILLYRTSHEELTVLHMAVDIECSSSGKYAEEMIVIRILEKIKNDSRRIRGLKRIYIPYIHKVFTI